MKIFILERIDQVSYSYHSEGGLVIIAKDLEQAKEIIKEDENIKPTKEEWDSAIVYELKDIEKPGYYTFPDAGCC